MEKDLQKKGYFYAPERFADLINGLMCVKYANLKIRMCFEQI